MAESYREKQEREALERAKVENQRMYSKLFKLIKDQCEWSQATFGSDKTRGPVGALKHLAKEAIEAAAAPGDLMEYADCLLLLLDACRRAGFTLADLVDAAAVKMVINKKRVWPTPVSDEPVEHTEGRPCNS